MNDVVKSYQLIKTHKVDNWEELLTSRYVALFDKYDYIVGDVSANVVRITGFYESNFQKKSSYHLKRRCAYDAPYFIVKKKKVEE